MLLCARDQLGAGRLRLEAGDHGLLRVRQHGHQAQIAGDRIAERRQLTQPRGARRKDRQPFRRTDAGNRRVIERLDIAGFKNALNQSIDL